jgi:hypothetical protein
MMVGSYYCFDIPAALKTQIDDYFGNPEDYEFNFSLLYTLYAAPNASNYDFFSITFINGSIFDLIRLYFLFLEDI